MKILLVGEYSRLHNSLKEGLIAIGHQVTLISTGDYFKNFPADIKLKRTYDSGLLKKIKVGLYLLFGVDITSLSIKKQFYRHQDQLKGFEVVQFINENSFGVTPSIEKNIISFLKKNNKKLFLLSCGTDYSSVNYAMNDHLRYSVFEGYKNESIPKEKYKFALRYLNPEFIDLHNFMYEVIEGVIASDIDYHLPLKAHPKYLGLIPNPINLEKLPFIENSISNKINLFLGINKGNTHTKGIGYFQEALSIIENKYGNKVQIERAENLPYQEYINIYNKAHIVLDQVLSYDQGYNALEAMAKGKLVFTGAEKEFETYYNLKEKVAVNATPNVQNIVEALEEFILHPEEISKIGENARAFLEKEHDYVKVAKQYIATWNKT